MRASNSSSSISIAKRYFFFFFLFIFFALRSSSGDCSEYHHHHSPMATIGGLHDSQGSQNSVETEALARFAVDEHNKKQVAAKPSLSLSFYLFFHKNNKRIVFILIFFSLPLATCFECTRPGCLCQCLIIRELSCYGHTHTHTHIYTLRA